MKIEASFPIMFGGYDVDNRIHELRAAHIPFAVVCIPWAIIQPHEKQAMRNHSLTLKRLAERGGLSADEAVAVLKDRPYRRMTTVEANVRLVQLMEAAKP